MIAFIGALSGLLLVQLSVRVVCHYELSKLGIQLNLVFREFDYCVLVGIVALASLVIFIPARHAYRNSLADGLTIRTQCNNGERQVR